MSGEGNRGCRRPDNLLRPKLPPGPGRRGVPNKIGRQAKENIIEVFSRVGGIPAMATWARKNRTEFYRLYARLIPLTVHAAVDVRHASEYSDDELARIVASSGSSGTVSEEASDSIPVGVH
jgi:hypothetical protein